MMSTQWTINVAALVADEGLHDPCTLRAFHLLRHFSSCTWYIKSSAMANGLNKLFMVLLKCNFKAFFFHRVLPFVKLLHCPQDCESMASKHHRRPFAQQSPTTLIFVGKQLLDFLCNWVNLLVNFGQEQALYTIPKLPQNAMVFSSFTTLSNRKQLDVNLRFLNDGIIRKGSCFLCELLDPFVVFTSIEEYVLLFFYL